MTDPETIPVRAALYARVSTDEQREGQTIESQIAELERFVEQNGWTIAGIYKDDGWSGSILARPELDRLRDDGTKGIFDMVIVNDVDRLARDVAHLGIIKRDFERKQIQLVFRKLPGQNSPTYNLMVNILGSFAEFEREVIIDRTRRGRRHKVEVRKQYVGCVAPYGYHYETKSATDGNEARIEIVPSEARVVKQIYQWASGGLSMSKIAARLSDMGIATRKGRLIWGPAVIYKILRNEAYAGIWSYGKADTCEPTERRNKSIYRRKTRTSRRPKPKAQWLRINLPNRLILIEPSTWKAVQERIDRNPGFSPRNAQSFYILQGLLKCGLCGAAYSGTFCRVKQQHYFYYRCWKRDCKKSRWIRRETLDAVIWSALHRALLDPKQILKRMRASRTALSREGEQLTTSEPDASQRIKEEEIRAIQKYHAGSLSPTELARQLEMIKSRRESELQTANMERDKPKPLTVERTQLESCRQFAERLQDPTPEKRREILRLLIVGAIVETDRVKIQAKIPDGIADNEIQTPNDDLGIALSPSRESKRNTIGTEFQLTVNLSGTPIESPQ